MVVPGFSVSDLIEAVDWTTKFIIELNQVRDQVHGLLKDLETSRNQLEGLKVVLQKGHQSVNHRAALFNTLQEELHEILNDSVNLLKQFHPDVASNSGFLSNLRQNFRWMVDSKYQGTVKGLQKRISKIERSIDRELHLLNIHYQQDSYEARNAHLSSVQQSADASSPLGKETLPTPFPATSKPSTAEEQLPEPLTYPGQQWPCVPVCAPSSPPPPPLPPASETHCSESDPNHQIIDGPALPSLPSRSLTALTGTTICTSYIDDLRPEQPIKRASTLPCTPFTREKLSNKDGSNPKNPNRLQSHRVESVEILRDGAGYFRGIKMTRQDGRILNDEISPYWSNVTKHPLPVHGRHTRELHDSDGQARNCMRFIQDKKGPGVPKYYSFSNDEDYRVFQSKIAGKSLLFWAEVQSISSAWSKTPLCEIQIVQLWQSNGVRSIQFFRNGKDRVYSQHSVSSLRIDKSSSKGLKLVFVGSEGTLPPGTVLEQEQIMKHLLIVFTNPKVHFALAGQ